MSANGSGAHPYALGIDLGGSSIKSVAITSNGEILVRRTLEFEVEQPMDWAAKIRGLAGEVQSELERSAASMGLAAPGLAAKDGRSVAYLPERLLGLEGLDWAAFLRAQGESEF